MKLKTQQEFVAVLRSELLPRATTKTVHELLSQGLPSLEIGKRKFFDWEACRAWILSARETSPIALEVRGRMMDRRYRKTG